MLRLVISDLEMKVSYNYGSDLILTQCWAGLEPAPPVGFNLTFMCPEGQVGLILVISCGVSGLRP